MNSRPYLPDHGKARVLYLHHWHHAIRTASVREEHIPSRLAPGGQDFGSCRSKQHLVANPAQQSDAMRAEDQSSVQQVAQHSMP